MILGGGSSLLGFLCEHDDGSERECRRKLAKLGHGSSMPGKLTSF